MKFKDYLFWILWVIEALFMAWWLLDELSYVYLSVNPVVYIGVLWVAAAFFAYKVFKKEILGLILVIIPGIPLAFMAAYLLLILLITIFDGPIRWN